LSHATRFATLFAVSSLCAFGQFSLAFLQPLLTASNGAKGVLSAAPGTFIAIKSRGPTFPADLSTVLIDLTIADQTFHLPAVEPPDKSSLQVWAVIPIDAPLGSATIKVQAFSGVNYPPAIQIEAIAPGIFTRNNLGYGLASALDKDGAPIRLTNAAQPGHEVSLYATGLGGLTTSDVSVEIAGEQAVVMFAGPQGYPGLDQINLVVPQDAFQGCYVPVVLRVQGVASNMATLSIGSDPGSCAHPFGLTPSELAILDEGGSLLLAHVTVSSHDGPEDTWDWKEVGQVSFPRADANQLYALSGPQMPEQQYFSCPALIDGADAEVRVDNPDVGGAITMTGPRGKQLILTKPYAVTAPPLEAPFFAPGLWQMSAPGGADILGFSQSFLLPPGPSSLNVKRWDVLPLDRDWQLTWNRDGFGLTDILTIQLGGGSIIHNGVTVPNPKLICRTPAWAGRLIISQEQLAALRTGPNLLVTVGPNPVARPLFRLMLSDGTTIPGYADYTFSTAFQVRFE